MIDFVLNIPQYENFTRKEKKKEVYGTKTMITSVSIQII